MAHISDSDRQAIEAAVFQRLVRHLRDHNEVQNIDLMNLADFCRNCLSKWYAAAAAGRGVIIEYEQARELIYGMPYSEWKSKYQKKMSPGQQATFKARKKNKLGD